MKKEFKVVGCSKIDKYRRVTLTKLFQKKPYPEQISLRINLNLEMLEIRLNCDEDIICQVDHKGRIIIPVWICNELKLSYGDIYCFRLVKYGNQKFLSPGTGTIL